eukprot:TRINITY_DN10136_c0_g1_i6.p5 TRINITY_DN10136_c0_g1~~TRINITY_DN10136_c0_g1_i6.p5  ORF type:complete len:148 (-),score=12.85 TRINITY_DN10136_c0_g1_i6:1781-2224(-)
MIEIRKQHFHSGPRFGRRLNNGSKGGSHVNVFGILHRSNLKHVTPNWRDDNVVKESQRRIGAVGEEALACATRHGAIAMHNQLNFAIHAWIGLHLEQGRSLAFLQRARRQAGEHKPIKARCLALELFDGKLDLLAVAGERNKLINHR